MTAHTFTEQYISEIPVTSTEVNSSGQKVTKNILISDLASHIKIIKNTESTRGVSTTIKYQIVFDGYGGDKFTITEATYNAIKQLLAPAE